MAVGLQMEQVAVQVQEKRRQIGWVSARQQMQKLGADRGFKGNRRGLGRGVFF